jgi:uncharacterized SAM-binding protein YcdF (DUF218 family)
MPENAVLLFLSKLLPIFVFPLGLTLCLLLLGGMLLLIGKRRLACVSIATAVAVLWICSTPVVANWAIASLERQYPALTLAETPEADVAIVLGGVLGQPLPPRTAVELVETSDRVLHAARLYRAGKVGRILVAAGNLPWDPAVKPEAELIRELLVEWGVTPDAIDIGTRSRNTYENAIEIERMWKAGGFKSALLVTSAAHMPRAMATFRRVGVPVIASATDVTVVDVDRTGPLDWLPNASALTMTTGAMHEWLGYLAYKARGYL